MPADGVKLVVQALAPPSLYSTRAPSSKAPMLRLPSLLMLSSASTPLSFISDSVRISGALRSIVIAPNTTGLPPMPALSICLA